ncbi:MAG TPA: O-antigen translocase [Aquaticitalea sp.]|nr:O-antigen translocase [Aquaticitalea sp.]
MIKIASINSVAVLIRIISGFLTSKAIAIFIGTEGMALVGNLRDFVSSARSFSTLGFSNGIVKYVAEFKNNALELSKTLSTVFYIGLVSTLIVSIYCFVDAQRLNDILFTSTQDYAYVIKILAIALPFYALNTLVLSVINGFSNFKKLLYINIASQIVGMILTLYLIWQERLQGALVAIATVESLILLVTFIGVYNQKFVLKLITWKNIHVDNLKKMGSYSLMALFTAVALPIVSVAIRNYIIKTQGLHEAGLWEAMNRISGYYLMFVSTLLTLYLLPKFAEITTKREFRKEVFDFYKTIIPIFGLGLIVIYFLRFLIIKVVLTTEFLAVESLFFWQLLGDFLKVLSIVIAYQFLAKRMFWHYIITEALSMLVLYFASIYFIELYGAKGATMAHFVDYVFYLILMVVIFWNSLFGKLEE